MGKEQFSLGKEQKLRDYADMISFWFPLKFTRDCQQQQDPAFLFKCNYKTITEYNSVFVSNKAIEMILRMENKDRRVVGTYEWGNKDQWVHLKHMIEVKQHSYCLYNRCSDTQIEIIVKDKIDTSFPFPLKSLPIKQ